MDVHFLDEYDVSASDEEAPNDRAEWKTVDETTVATTTARDDAMGAKREREVETTASRDEEATEARAGAEDGTRDADDDADGDDDDDDDDDADAFDSSGGRSIVERGTADEGVEADADAVDANRGDAEIAEIVQGWGHRVQSAEFAAETFGERCCGVGREGRRGFRAWDIGRGGAGRRRAARGSRGRDETVAVG